jgi:HEAT repeat protein
MPFGPPDIEKLRAVGDVSGLITALAWPSSQVRRNAAQALGQIGAPAAEPLAAALRDPDPVVREAAAGALGQIGTAAVEPLVTALGGTDSLVQGVAVETLVQIGAPAVEPLIATLKDPDPFVRKAAISALGRIGDARAVVALGGDPDPGSDLLVDLFDARGTIWDPDEGDRMAATEALGQLGDGRAVEPLCTMLVDSPLAFRKAAALALVAIYGSDKIAEAQRVRILSQRATIAATHEDLDHADETKYQSVVGGSSDCGRHTDHAAVDRGIGVDFPI